MVGVSIAAHLQKRGKHVVLLDRRPPAEETSYGNGGLVQREAVFPHPFPREVAELRRIARKRSIDVHNHLSALPGLAPVAMAEGRYVARAIQTRLRGQPVAPFHYFDKGNLATIGRNRAVAEFGRLHISGFFAWIVWLFVHLMYLVEFDNRLLVLIQWMYNYITRNRGARLITGPKA